MATTTSQFAFHEAKLIIFDFDGVIVDSNRAKLECFLDLAAKFGSEAVARLHALLTCQPHATRFEVVESILESAEATNSSTKGELLRLFSECSKSRILGLKVTHALSALREIDTRDWALVSATEEQDMKEIAHRQGIADYFQAGVFGTPTSKLDHIRALSQSYGIEGSKIIMLGDRISDLRASLKAGIGFIFVAEWSDASEGDLDTLENYPSVHSLFDLLLGPGATQ